MKFTIVIVESTIYINKYSLIAGKWIRDEATITSDSIDEALEVIRNLVNSNN